MKNKFRYIITALAAIIVTGCQSVDIQDYKETTPNLTIENYFDGETKAWGVFQDRFGKVRRRFSVDITGEWDKNTNTLTLVEDFDYDDGETERRIWEINKTGDNTYTGTADGVIGTATGQSSGNAFNFKYAFALPVNGKTWNVTFDDWMYLQDDNILFNRATIRRWGITLGDVYIFFDKRN